MKIKNCKHCSKEFESIKGSRYCSDDCRISVYRVNQKKYSFKQLKQSNVKGTIPIAPELLETCGKIKSDDRIDVTQFLPIDVMFKIQEYIKKKFSLEEILKRITNFKRKHIEIYYNRIVEG